MQDKENSNSSFLFGIIFGTIVGALIAIVIYKNNKIDIFDKLRSKIEKIVKKYLNVPSAPAKKATKPKSTKKPVFIPKDIASISTIPTRTEKSKKMFKNN